jgi:hypothetical protein
MSIDYKTHYKSIETIIDKTTSLIMEFYFSNTADGINKLVKVKTVVALIKKELIDIACDKSLLLPIVFAIIQCSSSRCSWISYFPNLSTGS